MPSACVATGRCSVPEHFLRCRGIVCSFLYAMWPECLTDNLTAEDEELRLHGLCWCSLPPSWGGSLHPPTFSRPSRLFCTPLGKINSFFLFLCRPSSRCLWFRLIYVLLYSVDPDVSLPLYFKLFNCSLFLFFGRFFCCLLSPEFGVFLPARSDCYKPICLQAFAITQGWLRDLCTLTLEGHWGQRWLKRDDSSPSDLFTQEHLFCFSFSQKHLKKRVVLICVPWYV